MRELLDDAPMPATAVAVVTPDRVLVEVTTGVADRATGEPAGPRSWWDLASLTKVLVTLPAVLRLHAAGQLHLDAPLREQWDRAEDTPAGDASPADLLSHRGGYPPTVDLYRHPGSGRGELVERALRTPRVRPIGDVAVYSDVGFLVLGELVADLEGAGLDRLAERDGPFRFAPLPEGATAVATEWCPWRRQLVRGSVHDENAHALGGVAGHAGAFGRLGDVLGAAQGWLLALRQGDPLASRAVAEHAHGPHLERYGLGWWLSPTGSLGGRRPGGASFGASGFVGNRLWFEPERGYAVVVLSNRVHPVRTERGMFDAWCTELLDAVFMAIPGSERPKARRQHSGSQT